MTHLDENILILNHQGVWDDKPRERLAFVCLGAVLQLTHDIL